MSRREAFGAGCAWAPLLSFRWTTHPVIVTIRDNRDYIRVLLYSYYTTITGWGVLLMNSVDENFMGPSATLNILNGVGQVLLGPFAILQTRIVWVQDYWALLLSSKFFNSAGQVLLGPLAILQILNSVGHGFMGCDSSNPK